MRRPPSMATRFTAEPTSIGPPPTIQDKTSQATGRKATWRGRVLQSPSEGARKWPSVLDVAVTERFDVDHQPVLETHAPHELVRPEIVDPQLHGHLDQVVAGTDAPAADPDHGHSPDGGALHFGRFAALGSHLLQGVVLGNEL